MGMASLIDLLLRLHLNNFSLLCSLRESAQSSIHSCCGLSHSRCEAPQKHFHFTHSSSVLEVRMLFAAVDEDGVAGN